MPTFDPIASITAFLETGGPVVALIACLSVVAVALILLKLVQFAREHVGRPARAERAVRLWAQGRRREAWHLVADRSSAAEEAVAIALEACEAAGHSKALVEEEVARAATCRLHRLGRGLKALDAIAQIAPLLGLFGTVLGMIEAFQQLQAAGNAVDPSLLAGGIWVTLLTTAAGLAVAMPVSLVVTFLESALEAERVAIETLSAAVLLAAAGGGSPAQAPQIEPRARVAHAH